MNNPLHFLLHHRSIRKFQTRSIDSELLDQIIDCGIRAATSGNMQFYSIIRTTDPKIKEELFIAHTKQPMILETPCVLTFCADLKRVQMWMEKSGATTRFDNIISLLRGFVDATICAQAIVSAAEASGLGTCYMGTTLSQCEEVIQALSIPPLVMPVTSLVLGWPDENPELRPRLARQHVVHEQKFQEQKYEDIAAIYKEKDADIIERWEKDATLREKMKTFGLTTGAQLYEHIKYSNEALSGFSQSLIQIIRKQFGIEIT